MTIFLSLANLLQNSMLERQINVKVGNQLFRESFGRWQSPNFSHEDYALAAGPDIYLLFTVGDRTLTRNSFCAIRRSNSIALGFARIVLQGLSSEAQQHFGVALAGASAVVL